MAFINDMQPDKLDYIDKKIQEIYEQLTIKYNEVIENNFLQEMNIHVGEFIEILLISIIVNFIEKCSDYKRKPELMKRSLKNIFHTIEEYINRNKEKNEYIA